MDFKEFSLCSWLVILVIFKIRSISAQLDLPSMPGPPYPDPRGQNRWGVKFDPKFHGPPFNKHKHEVNPGYKQNNYQRSPPPRQPSQLQDSYQQPLYPNSPQQSQSQDITYQRPPPPYRSSDNSYSPNYNTILRETAGNSQNPNGASYNNNNFVQASQQNQQQQYRPPYHQQQKQNQEHYKLWNSAQYNNNHNNYNNNVGSYNTNYNHNIAVRPPSALDDYNPKGPKNISDAQKEENYWNMIRGYFSKNQNKNMNNHEAHVHQPSNNFRFQANSNDPSRTVHKHWRNHKGKRGYRRPHGPPRHKRKPKKKQQSWKIFTTVGKGMDAVHGGVNSVRKVVKGTTGRVLATGVKAGGKVVYVGAQTLAKVITKVSSW